MSTYTSEQQLCDVNQGEERYLIHYRHPVREYTTYRYTTGSRRCGILVLTVLPIQMTVVLGTSCRLFENSRCLYDTHVICSGDKARFFFLSRRPKTRSELPHTFSLFCHSRSFFNITTAFFSSRSHVFDTVTRFYACRSYENFLFSVSLTGIL